MKALASMHIFADSPEPLLLHDAISSKIFCAGPFNHLSSDVKCSILIDIVPLIPIILMDYPIHNDTISMELSILNLKGSQIIK